MIDIRCPRCGKTIETLELDERYTFSEKYSEFLCLECKEEEKNSGPEEKLLDAIFGRGVEDEVTEN